MYPADGRTRELLFKNADIAMYRAKAAGRSCFRFFSKDMASEAKVRLSLDTSLRRALPENEFRLHYQPRVNLATMQVSGVEALIRWSHPELGLVNPARFIPIAEANGLIESIGAWVIEEACRDAERLGRRLSRPIRVSVNVSAVQFRNPAIVATVARVLHATGLPPSLLELELTESALIEDIGNAATMLRALKTLGVGLAVDDFGTGYSALTYLRRFPMDVLKLDRSFILEKEQGSGNAFIKAFVDMAHSLGMSVVAEGVESADILQLLSSVQCDEVQGFYLAPPMPREDLEEYLFARSIAS
jgi:EAL domain-containing protein (putative c-di-GMP-specific phosphodiesterase class I)